MQHDRIGDIAIIGRVLFNHSCSNYSDTPLIAIIFHFIPWVSFHYTAGSSSVHLSFTGIKETSLINNDDIDLIYRIKRSEF